jgi:hypothetical protein
LDIIHSLSFFLPHIPLRQTQYYNNSNRKDKVKLPLFTGDMTLHLKDPKKSIKNLLDHKYFPQSSKVQNQHTKISNISISTMKSREKKSKKQYHSQ